MTLDRSLGGKGWMAFNMSTPVRTWLRVATLGLTLVLLQATDSAAKQRTLPQELSWIGLYNTELMEWLENENRLTELCGEASGGDKWHTCREALLEPKVAVISVRSGPQVTAGRLGQLVLVAWPGKGLRIFASSGRVTQPFTPDLFDGDWGYGPYFHQTILARRGPWFRVPVPVIGPGWINAEEWIDRGKHALEPTTYIETVDPERIITTPRGDMYVLGVEKRFLRVRPEQDRDMPCDGGAPAPPAPYQEIRIPFEQLFDAKGHLLVSVKYTRGC
jgi:hypothetical protein